MKLKKALEIFHLGGIILLGPLFVFPKSEWNWVMLFGVGLLFSVNVICRRQFLSKTPLALAIGLLCLLVFVNLLVMKDIESGAGKAAGFVYGVLVFGIVLGALRSFGRIKAAIIVFLLAGTGIAIIGTFDRGVEGGAAIPQIESRMVEVPRMKLNLQGAEAGVNPNPVGGMLLLFIPLAVMNWPLYMKKDSDNTVPRWRVMGLVGMSVILLILFVAVVLTSSFGTWLALALGLWLMGERKRPMKVIVAGFVMILAVFPFIKIGQNFKEGDTSTIATLNASIRSRVDMWTVGLSAVRERPITGIGMDQLRRRPDFPYENSHAHNQFLHTAAELGIPGMIAYAALLIGVFWMTREVRLSNLPDWMKLNSRGLGTGIFAFTIFGMGDAIPLGAKPGFLFWVSLAMITSIYLYGRENGLLKKDA